MPADMIEKNSSSPVAATPASMNTTPDKPKTSLRTQKVIQANYGKEEKSQNQRELGQLKTLILDALKKDAALNNRPHCFGKYRAGFSECTNEVTRFLSTCEGVNTEVRTRLLGHLGSCMGQINAMNYPSQHQQHQHQLPPTGGPTHPSFGQSMVQIPNSPQQILPMNTVSCKGGSSPGNLSPDATKVYGGFQIVPANDGQFAFLIPNAAFCAKRPCHPRLRCPPRSPVGQHDSVWRPW
ncbi:hypothetical protein KUCAC02_022310 [Chaenocephalus aceratus]|uniref:Uncharacterized protein n=1 Tax=Chaenocephalus aceratus TaxID=36190 RepID=A0ACB9XNC1_CHAAC|nr:hypothetical protein KUCAC02_022310 [Chaenocephalus aceratus]